MEIDPCATPIRTSDGADVFDGELVLSLVRSIPDLRGSEDGDASKHDILLAADEAAETAGRGVVGAGQFDMTTNSTLTRTLMPSILSSSRLLAATTGLSEQHVAVSAERFLHLPCIYYLFCPQNSKLPVAQLNCPIIGDPKYPFLIAQLLAAALFFNSPIIQAFSYFPSTQLNCIFLGGAAGSSLFRHCPSNAPLRHSLHAAHHAVSAIALVPT